MSAVRTYLASTLRLFLRNKMALAYSFLTPLLAMAVFWVLYRNQPAPLWRHMGQLLTITVLGVACFGLPTAMVSERERGVWRRYRLTPVHTGALVFNTFVARFIVALVAGALQVGLAFAFKTPAPYHPLDLLVAYCLVCFAFLGLGLVIATLADNVPAVQAIGQCIFLPMLIIGGVGLSIETMPMPIQHLASFFPGRYAVEALDAAVMGGGLGEAKFSLAALVLIGAAACLAGTKLFRWDALQRFSARNDKAWLGAALAAWVVVGLAAESQGRIAVLADRSEVRQPPVRRASFFTGQEPVSENPAPAQPGPVADAPAPAPVAPPPATPPPTGVPFSSAGETPPPAPLPEEPKRWQDVTDQLIFSVNFAALYRWHPNNGNISPLADEDPDEFLAEELKLLAPRIAAWAPGKVEDPVQRARNLILIAGSADYFKMEPLEAHLPWLIYELLQQRYPPADLKKVLYWVIMHPDEGSHEVAWDLTAVGVTSLPGERDMREIRARLELYAGKFLAMQIGFNPPQ